MSRPRRTSLHASRAYVRTMGPRLDRPVLVIDLRAAALADEALAGSEARGAHGEHETTASPVAEVAILHDGSDDPLVLSIEPTRDLRFLDALARLVRFAVLHRRRVASVAVSYGGEYERRLLFERRLPRWSVEGLDVALPPALGVLRRRRRR